MSEGFKQQLEAALREPPAPPGLVERTIRRCQAVTRGRLAEERLAGEGDNLSREERRALAADGLLGRLSMRMDIPEGLDNGWLTRQEAFCRAVDRPAADILTGLRQGVILQQMTSGVERRVVSPKPRGPEKTGPVR